MNIILVILGMNILLVFTFKRDWLLIRKSYIILAVFNLILFGLSYILRYYSLGDPRFLPLLRVLFIYQLLFFPLVWIFRNLYYKDPVDTFWSMDIKLMRDGIFNFIYVVLLFFIIILLV